MSLFMTIWIWWIVTECVYEKCYSSYAYAFYPTTIQQSTINSKKKNPSSICELKLRVVVTKIWQRIVLESWDAIEKSSRWAKPKYSHYLVKNKSQRK